MHLWLLLLVILKLHFKPAALQHQQYSNIICDPHMCVALWASTLRAQPNFFPCTVLCCDVLCCALHRLCNILGTDGGAAPSWDPCGHASACTEGDGCPQYVHCARSCIRYGPACI